MSKETELEKFKKIMKEYKKEPTLFDYANKFVNWLLKLSLQVLFTMIIILGLLWLLLIILRGIMGLI